MIPRIPGRNTIDSRFEMKGGPNVNVLCPVKGVIAFSFVLDRFPEVGHRLVFAKGDLALEPQTRDRQPYGQDKRHAIILDALTGLAPSQAWSFTVLRKALLRLFGRG